MPTPYGWLDDTDRLVGWWKLDDPAPGPPDFSVFAADLSGYSSSASYQNSAFSPSAGEVISLATWQVPGRGWRVLRQDTGGLVLDASGIPLPTLGNVTILPSDSVRYNFLGGFTVSINVVRYERWAWSGGYRPAPIVGNMNWRTGDSSGWGLYVPGPDDPLSDLEDRVCFARLQPGTDAPHDPSLIRVVSCPLALGEEATLTGVYNQSLGVQRLYKNGHLQEESEVPHFAIGGRVRLGAGSQPAWWSSHEGAWNEYWSGDLWDLRVWAKALDEPDAHHLDQVYFMPEADEA